MIKKLLVFATIVLVVQYWGDIKNTIYPPPDYSLAHDGKVILYSTSWCGYCAKARDFMKENDIEYFEYDIEQSTEGHDQYKTLGGRGIPVLLIKGEVIKGYNPQRILQLAKPT